CFETIGAEPRVGTDAAIVVDGDPLAGVTGTLIPAVVSGAPIGEAIGSMCTVAERLAAGTATAAEGYPSNRGTRLALGTAQVGHRGWRGIVEEVVRAVRQARDFGCLALDAHRSHSEKSADNLLRYAWHVATAIKKPRRSGALF